MGHIRNSINRVMDSAVGAPTLVTLITTRKANGQANACLHAWGLLVGDLRLLSVGALHCTAEDLDGPAHLYEVPRRSEVYLNLDWHQMGVGGDDNWGARPHKEFIIPGNRRCAYRFCLRPYDPSLGDVRQVARKAPATAPSSE
jgi:hypothetical protein